MPASTESSGSVAPAIATTRPEPPTLVAFAAAAIFGGGNAVAIRVGFAELAPFWGAALRFLAAAALLLAAGAVMRLALPRGRALVGTLLYGFLNFGLSYMFAYLALTEVTAGTAMTVLAIVPLLTLLLAVAQGIEAFRWRGVIGALVAAAGVALVFGDNIGAASPLALASLAGSALCIAQVPIVVKKFPPVHAVVENGLGMLVGGAWLLALSGLLAEPWIVPADPWVQGSLIYLVLFGSIGVFLLYLYVLSRWTASASSYIMIIAPLAAISLGFLVLGEPASSALLLGGAFVIVGVYVGAIAGSRTKGSS